jgi:hypothetical protein
MDPKRNDPQQQQQGGTGQQQQQAGTGQQYGEGNYKATRDYNAGLKEHVEHHDIEREARDAEPRSEEEARELEAAECEGRSRSKGEGEEARKRPDPNSPKTEL